MAAIHTTAHTNSDGRLDVEVLTGLPETDVDVVVLVRPASSGSAGRIRQGQGWPGGFLEETYGSCPDLERLPQGEADSREPLA